MAVRTNQPTSAIRTEALPDGRTPRSMVASDRLSEHGYRVPQEGSVVRLAFVGQATYFKYCVLEHGAGGVEPGFIDFRSGSDPQKMLEDVKALDPHVVFVFRPEIVPGGLFGDLPALTVGYLTEPLPRPGEQSHPDLERRLEYLSAIDAGNFDRIVSFDPLIVTTIDRFVKVWRSFPLPVADTYYAPVQPSKGKPSALFIGRATTHRDLWLDPVKHEFDVVHLAHGITDKRLMQFFTDCEIGINLHNEAYPTYENRVSLSLAAGLLVVTEPLSPTFGLEPGIDYVEVKMPWELRAVLFNATRYPEMYRRVRIRGRRKAETFRASRVYPRLVHDLLLDFAAFGTGRSLS
jgi:hypothetical protein